MPYIAISPHQSGPGSLMATTLIRGDNIPDGTTGQRSNGSITGLYQTVTTSVSAAEVVANNGIPESTSGHYHKTTSTISAPSEVSTPYLSTGGILVDEKAESNISRNITGENHRNAGGILAAVMIRGNGTLEGTSGQLQTNVPAAVVMGGAEGSFESRGNGIPGQPHQRTVAHRRTFNSMAAAASDSSSSENTPGPSRQGSIDDTEPAGPMNAEVSILANVRVAGVEVVESYSECITCSNRVVPDGSDPELGTCLQCSMMQRMDDTNVVLGASLVLRVGEREFLPLRAFGGVVEFIAQKPAADVSMKALLKAEPFTVSHRGGVIVSATRSTESTTQTIGHTVSLQTS